MEETSNARPLFKLGFLLATFLGLIGIAFLVSRNILEKNTISKETILTAPFKNVLWQDFGMVVEPEIDLELKTVNRGYEKQAFLLDSGAVVSALPREVAEKLGQNLAFLPRSTFQGFGNTTTFAYQGEMKVKIGSEEAVLPVVFTEAMGTKAILGRKGFFEQFTISFDHQKQRVEIKK